MDKSSTKNKGLYRKILSHVKVFWPIFIVIIISSAGYSACDTYVIGPLVKKIINSWDDIEFLRTVPFIMVSLFFLRGLSGFISAYFISYISRKTVRLFRNLIFEKFSKLPVDFIDKISSAELTSKLTYNVELITQASGNTLITFVRDGCLVIFLLAYMIWTSWLISVIIIIVLPVIGILVYFVSKRFRVLGRRLQSSMGSVTKLCIEVLQGYQDVRVFNAQNRKTDQFKKAIDYNYRQEMKVALLNSLNSPVIQFICVCVLAGVIGFIFHGAKPLMSSGSFVSIIGATAMLLKPIKNLTSIQSTIQGGLAAAESVFEILEYDDEPVLNSNARKEIDWKVKGHIEFKKVSFSYQADKTKDEQLADTVKKIALKDISFEIKPGKTVALVGPSGAGKSTIMKMLAQFYDATDGDILLDKHSIYDCNLHDYRSNFALVSQQIHLFDDTISQNLLFSKPDATEDQMIKALKLANAWEFVENLPNKLETILGEQALSLSGGQRQRIAIARAILKDAPILLLDEATSALDTASEAAIQSAFDKLSKTRTTLVIAHRLSTIKDADQIIYLEDGKIYEKGTYKQLLDKKGKFYAMHEGGIK
jgi:ATP-binding cassette, subfamily B, bacterial MsbA